MNREFLEKYLETYRPSGYEKDGAGVFVDSAHLDLGADYEFVDAMWNGCVSIGSDREDATRVLLSGHSDQNCLMVSEITKDGFLKFISCGGVSSKTLIDCDMQVLVNDGTPKEHYVPAFCSWKAIHLEKPEDRKKAPELKDLVLDLGCNSKEEVEALDVKVGDLVLFDNSNLKLDFGPSGDYIVGSGLDDGIAVCIVYDVLAKLDVEELKRRNIRVYGAAISSEETGARGVGPVVRKVQPDISIDIDVTHDTCKEVGGRDTGSTVQMGKGPVVCFGPDKSRTLTREIVRLAEANQIDFQVEAGKAGGTNTNPIQMQSDNCHTSLISIACRYMHSANHEMVSKKDCDGAVDLISEYIKTV